MSESRPSSAALLAGRGADRRLLSRKGKQLNTELFKKIDDIIATTPERFCMGNWEGTGGSCGTTRCQAGWAISLTTGSPIRLRTGELHSSVVALAREHGIDPTVEEKWDVFEKLGGALLGLDPGEAFIAFYLPDAEAVRFVHAAAQGDEHVARRILSDWDAE